VKRPLVLWLAWATLALTLAGPAGAAPTSEVVVLTSFPKELFEAYKQAFEQQYPGIKVIVKQQQTNQAVTYLRETRASPEADIIWASAMDAFQTLKDDGLLDRIALPRETLARMPAKVGGFPLHDPDGQYPSTARGRPTRPSTTRSRTSPT
jgi:ABC-type glycerol-3-phosphate transport system substrate-binding protein